MRRFSLLTLLAVMLTLGVFGWLNFTPTHVSVSPGASRDDELDFPEWSYKLSSQWFLDKPVNLDRYGWPYRVATKRSVHTPMLGVMNTDDLLSVPTSNTWLTPQPIVIFDTSDYLDESWNRKHLACNIAIALAAMLTVGLLVERGARASRSPLEKGGLRGFGDPH